MLLLLLLKQVFFQVQSQYFARFLVFQSYCADLEFTDDLVVAACVFSVTHGKN